MLGILKLALAVEDVSAESLAYCHSQVHIQTNPSDPHAGILLVGGQQVGVVVCVVVVMRMACMAASLGVRTARHGGRGNVSCAVGGLRPIEAGTERLWEAAWSCRSRGPENTALSGNGRGW